MESHVVCICDYCQINSLIFIIAFTLWILIETQMNKVFIQDRNRLRNMSYKLILLYFFSLANTCITVFLKGIWIKWFSPILSLHNTHYSVGCITKHITYTQDTTTQRILCNLNWIWSIFLNTFSSSKSILVQTYLYIIKNTKETPKVFSIRNRMEKAEEQWASKKPAASYATEMEKYYHICMFELHFVFLAQN